MNFFVSVLACQLAVEVEKKTLLRTVINLWCSVSCWWWEKLREWNEINLAGNQQTLVSALRHGFCLPKWTFCHLKSRIMPLYLGDLNPLNLRVYVIGAAPESVWPLQSLLGFISAIANRFIRDMKKLLQGKSVDVTLGYTLADLLGSIK